MLISIQTTAREHRSTEALETSQALKLQDFKTYAWDLTFYLSLVLKFLISFLSEYLVYLDH